MDGSDCWSVLEIAPTDDLRLIRSAYARKLKTIDAEAEPMRFVELREAYDIARALQDDAEARSPLLGEAPQPRATESNALGHRSTEQLAWEITTLLASAATAAAIEDPLSDLTLRLLAEIDRETVDRQFEAEEWVASVIAENIPRSDAMIRPAVAQFGWLTRKHGQYRADKATLVTDRLRDLDFAQFLVLREGGRHHLAYLTLQQPPRAGLLASQDYAAMAALERFFRETGDVPRVANIDFDEATVEQWHRQLRRRDLDLQRWKRHSRSQSGTSRVAARALGFMAILVLLLIAITIFAHYWRAPG